MALDLTTTNALLGIMAAVSLLEAIAVLGLFLAGALLFRKIGKWPLLAPETHAGNRPFREVPV